MQLVAKGESASQDRQRRTAGDGIIHFMNNEGIRKTFVLFWKDNQLILFSNF